MTAAHDRHDRVLQSVSAPTTAWGILKAIGPGLILTANIVGTGELIATTRLGSQVGFMLLWFIVFSCFIKVFVQIELGRYTLAEGVGSLEALNRLPGPRFRVSWVLWLWFVDVSRDALPDVGHGRRHRGAVCREVEHLGASWVGDGVAVLTGLLLSAGPLQVCREELDRHGRAVHVLESSGGGASSEHRVAHDRPQSLRKGLSFGLPDDLITAFAVFGITGVGAAELIFYPIWCLEKGYAKATGPRDDSPEWYERARGWMRVMKYDAWFSMVDLHRRDAELLRAWRRHPASSRRDGRQ